MRNVARELLPTVQTFLDALDTDFPFGNIAVLGTDVITAEVDHQGVPGHLRIDFTGENVLVSLGQYTASATAEPKMLTSHLVRAAEMIAVPVLV